MAYGHFNEKIEIHFFVVCRTFWTNQNHSFGCDVKNRHPQQMTTTKQNRCTSRETPSCTPSRSRIRIGQQFWWWQPSAECRISYRIHPTCRSEESINPSDSKRKGEQYSLHSRHVLSSGNRAECFLEDRIISNERRKCSCRQQRQREMERLQQSDDKKSNKLN